MRPDLKLRIVEANSQLEEAQKELDKAVKDIDVGTRADKTMMSKVLQVAFDKVTAARDNLKTVLENDEV